MSFADDIGLWLNRKPRVFGDELISARIFILWHQARLRARNWSCWSVKSKKVNPTAVASVARYVAHVRSHARRVGRGNGELDRMAGRRRSAMGNTRRCEVVGPSNDASPTLIVTKAKKKIHQW